MDGHGSTRAGGVSPKDANGAYVFLPVWQTMYLDPIEVQPATMTGWFTSNHPEHLGSFLSPSDINVPIKSQPGPVIRLMTFHKAARVACRNSISMSRMLVEVELSRLGRLSDENKLRT